MSGSRGGITDHVNKDECDEHIEWEGHSDDLSNRSIEKDKDFEIERNLVSLQIILGNLVRNMELVKTSHSQLCELVNLETPDIEPTSKVMGLESRNSKMLGENCCARNVHYLRENKYLQTIEEEGPLNENDDNSLELEETEEGANNDDLSSGSTDKDYKIDKILQNLKIVLEDLEINVELVQARHSQICELVNLKMLHTS